MTEEFEKKLEEMRAKLIQEREDAIDKERQKSQ